MPCDARLLDVTAAPSGASVERYRLQAGPVAVEVLNAGAAISRIDVPGRDGAVANVVLGYRALGDYLHDRREYFGAVVGRVANRIARGRFELDGRSYALATNNGPNHLHGGRHGFDRRAWTVAELAAERDARIGLTLVSADGEEGYPGELSVRATYVLSPDGVLRLECEAVTSAPTLVNLTNHAYFNLAGEGAGDILDHVLWIDAPAYCPVDETLIPTGSVSSVERTPFDFRSPGLIGPRLSVEDPQLAHAGGFDHCLALDGWSAHGALRHACTLVEPASGRRLRIATDQPGVQFYSGNFLDGTAIGPSGVAYGRHAGLCLETQHFPDAPHRPGFPSIVLRPGERYATATSWRFDVLP